MTIRRLVTFNHNPLLERGLEGWRARLVLGLILLGSLALIVRAAWLQGFNDDMLKAQGEQRYTRTLAVPATRGRITDRNGDVLAVSSPVRAIWAIPQDARLEPAEARELAELLGTEVETLNRLLASERPRVYLHRQVSPERARRIAEMKLAGIHQDPAYRRFYPVGEVTAHLVGFTNIDELGQEGMERAFNDVLRGEAGARRVIRDNRGRIIEDIELLRAPRDGENLALSIDNQIQFLAYSALEQAMQEHRAKAGSAVVLDVRTGEVLALVNAPTFNPNNRSGLSGTQLRNRALTDLHEPGSTVKPFIAAMAIEAGHVLPDTGIDTDKGRIRIGRAVISDVSERGMLTVSEVIQKSSNVGVVKMAMDFEPEPMWELFDSIGMGRRLALDFPGAANGLLRSADSWRPIEQATMSFGHGLSTTLMHMARAYLAFAREGDLLPISLLKRDTPPTASTQIFKPATVHMVREMLEGAVGPDGTGQRASVTGYRVAGKTGTAHKLVDGQYANKYMASFIGFAPVSNPRIVVAVMIDEPSAGKHYGGVVAAPVFARITEGALRSLGVAPDAPLAPLHLADGHVAGERM